MQTQRVGRLVAGTEPEDEDEADWEADVVPRVDGARRRQNTAPSVYSDCDSREQQPRGRWASVTLEASPERSVDEEVGARQRGRSPTVLGCGRLELKKRHRGPEKRDNDGRDTRPVGPTRKLVRLSTSKKHDAHWVLEERQVQKNAAGPPSVPECASRSRRLLWMSVTQS